MNLTAEQIKQALEFCANCECNSEKTEKECALINMSFCKNYLRKQSLDYINRLEAENGRLQAENKGLTKEKEKAWDLFKKKCDEDIELQSLCDKHRLEIERLKEKTRNIFTGVINKFLSLEDLYVIVEDEFVPWEPTEEVEHLFKMSISGDTEENVREIDRVIKELVGDSDE